MKKALIAFALLVSLLATGCAGVHNSMKPSEKLSQWNPVSRNKQKKESKKAMAPPDSMAVIWKDNTYQADTGLVVRGFEGRLTFYDAKNEPVKGEGDLIIYGYDDTEATPADKSRTPQKKFVISAEELESNYLETQLGPSYRVWIPWEPVGGYRKSISLIPVFRMADGQIIRSGSSINVLPGKSAIAKEDKQAERNHSSKIAQAGFSGKTADGTQQADQAFLQEDQYNQSQIRTTTIPLVPTLSSRLSMPQTLPVQSVPQTPPRKQAGEAGGEIPRTITNREKASHDNTNGNQSTSNPSEPTTSRNRNTGTRPVFGQPGSIQ